MLALIIAGNRSCTAACSPNGVDLVDENDAGGVLACLGKQVAHAAGTHPDEELDEVGGATTVERYASLARHRTRQQGLAGTRWADEQDALGNMRPDSEKALRVAQEVDDLAQFELG